MSKETVAFFGIGALGLPMSINLVKAGYRVIGFDVNPERLTDAVGVERATSPLAAAQQAQAVVIMVPSGVELRQLLIERDIAAHLQPNAIIIDGSTVDLDSAAAAKAAAARHGHDMVDAPVSGGAVRAEAATLTIMVGGTPKAFERAKPILDAMSNNVVHVGAGGSGLTLKYCNNMIAAVTMAGVSEALSLALRLGIDGQIFFDVVSRASGSCWALNEMCPIPGPVPTSPSNNGYKAGGAAALLRKDLAIAQGAAAQNFAPIPMASAAHALFTNLCNAGLGHLDTSAVIKLYLDGTEIGAQLPGPGRGMLPS